MGWGGLEMGRENLSLCSGLGRVETGADSRWWCVGAVASWVTVALHQPG